MAAERVSLDVRMREERGSAAMRRMRKEGLVPGVVYGGEADVDELGARVVRAAKELGASL